jgi:hypothetical protein
LTFEELLVKKATAEVKGDSYVVWKSGRTTQTTFGIVSRIESDARSESGVVSDELAVIDYHKTYPLSDIGDAGSLVWDYDGFVCGMICGGKGDSFVTYVTPIEYVLEDIKAVCGANDVRLVVRDEEETDVVFRTPARDPASTTAAGGVVNRG